MEPLGQINTQSSYQASNEKTESIGMKDLAKRVSYAIVGTGVCLLSYSMLTIQTRFLWANHNICKSLSANSQINNLFDPMLSIKQKYLPCMARELPQSTIILGTGLIAARLSYSCFKKVFAPVNTENKATS